MNDRLAAFDPVKFKQTTRAQWETAAEAWDRWGPFIGRWLKPATDRMLDLAQIGPGSHVVDVAAGAGEQTLEAGGPRLRRCLLNPSEERVLLNPCQYHSPTCATSGSVSRPTRAVLAGC